MGRWTVTAAQVSSAPSRAGPSAPQASPLGLRRSAGSGSRAPVSALLLALFAAALLALSFATPASAAAVTLGLSTGVEASAASLAEYQAQAEGYERGYRDDDEDGYHPSSASSRGRGGRNDDHSAAHAYYYNKGARSDQDHRSASSSHRSSSASSRNRNEHYANYAANHAPAPAHDSASLPQRPASPFADHEPAPAPAPAAPAAPQQLRRRSAFADVPVSAIETMQAATSESHRHVPPAPHVRLHQPEHFRTLSVKLIDSPLVDVKWSVKRSKAGHFTQHVVFGLSAQGVVYRSVDGGHVWESQAERFKHAKVLSVHVSKADSSYIAFRCAHGVHFFTADAGTTYQTPAEITYLHNHPLTDSNSPFFGGAAVDPLSFLSDVVTGINDALRPEGADPRDDEIMPEHVAEVVQTMRVAEFKHHPSRAGWILASVHSRGCFKGSIKNPTAQETAEEQKFGEEDSKTLCYLRLLVSLDNGRVWKQIISHAVQFDWGAPADTPRGHRDEKLIYVCGYLANDVQPVTTSWDPNIHFMESRDFFEDADLLVVHGNRFFTGHGYLFVAADDVTTSLENDVALFIRPPGGKAFQRAHIPISGLDQFSYTILDTAEGQVFLHVNHAPLSHRASSGHLYVSDAEGTMFSLSLMNIQRSQEGHCAFARVEAVEGVFLSNFLADAEGAESSFLDEGNPMGVSDSDAASLFSRRSGARSALQPRALTAITYNKGASWFHLVPPERDSQNRAIACEPDSEGRPCQLHLHGLAQDEHGPFYSDDRAPGMILATGSVGHYVHQHQGGVNTYVSRDAGFTWHEVFKGSHVYEFGDHGGLIVMADDTKPTQFLYFSWDEGATWEGVQITSLPFIVENIVVEPDQVNVQFVVYGYIPETANQHLADGVTSSGPRTTSASDAGVIAFVDFADLHKRTCQGARSPGGANSDYEYWSPHDSRMDGACLLGKRMSFLRRKQFAQCFNPLDRVPMQIMERCPCTVHDYQCDYGYFRQVEGGACVKDTLATYKSRDSIVTGASCKGTYLETKGYRRIPGDVCIGGAEWNPIVKPCPTRLGMGALLFFVVLLGAAVYALIHFHQKYDLIQLALDTYDRYYGRRAYVLVGGGNGPHGGDDDDDDLEAGVGPSKGSAPVPDYYDAAAVATGNVTSRKSMGGFHSVTATADDDESAEDTTSGAGVGVGSAIQSAAAMARGLGASVATKISAATGVSLGGMRATSEGGATYSAVAGGDGPAVDVATRLSPAASPIPPAAAASVPAPAPAPAAAAAASPAGSKGPVYFHERTDVDDLTDDDPLLAAAAVRSAARTPAKPPVATSVGTGAVQAPRVAPAAGAGELNAYASSAIPLPPRGGDDDAARTKAAFNLLD